LVKLGRAPGPAELTDQSEDWVALPTSSVLWRVHRTAGGHVVAWHHLRHWGPSDARFDPHLRPPSVQSVGVSYTSLDVPTCLAEAYQVRRVVNTVFEAPYLTAWSPRRELHLLDLSGTWPVRNGASHAINTGRHDLCRGWARAIYERWPAADGLYYRSAMTGRPSVALWTAAVNSFPARPGFSHALAAPMVRGLLQQAADEIGSRLL
jgi:hypothetical protein